MEEKIVAAPFGTFGQHMSETDACGRCRREGAANLSRYKSLLKMLRHLVEYVSVEKRGVTRGLNRSAVMKKQESFIGETAPVQGG
jgi:hypothetical protein